MGPNLRNTYFITYGTPNLRKGNVSYEVWPKRFLFLMKPKRRDWAKSVSESSSD